VTYPKSQTLRQLVGAIPLDRLLIETDAPFLPPQSRRGLRNEPSLVAEVAAAIAAELKLENSQVAAATSANAAAMFGW
jgi:TatD DNase family protein